VWLLPPPLLLLHWNFGLGAFSPPEERDKVRTTFFHIFFRLSE
jgi:hypothetical protein